LVTLTVTLVAVAPFTVGDWGATLHVDIAGAPLHARETLPLNLPTTLSASV
jgi:hypothetical protein